MTDTTMNSGQSQYVTAFFDSRGDAEAAVERIVAEGTPRSEIRVVEGSERAASAQNKDKGFMESLSDFFMPEEDRHSYAEGLSRGGYLVSLNTTSQNRDRVLDILDDEGTVDMDAREQSWRSEGWSGYQQPRGEAGEAGSIEVVEEQLRVGKREVDHGRVRVRSYVVETPVEEQVSLRDETVHLERKPVDRPVSGGDPFADRTLEVTETDEEAVVSKEARVTEEISLGKEVEQHTETVRDSVRHTEVEVDDERTR